MPGGLRRLGREMRKATEALEGMRGCVDVRRLKESSKGVMPRGPEESVAGWTSEQMAVLRLVASREREDSVSICEKASSPASTINQRLGMLAGVELIEGRPV